MRTQCKNKTISYIHGDNLTPKKKHHDSETHYTKLEVLMETFTALYQPSRETIFSTSGF